MAKSKSNTAVLDPIQGIRDVAEVTPGHVYTHGERIERPDIEMVTVKACGRIMDNGNRYAAGDVLHMEIHLVPAHVAAGQVEVIPKAGVEAAVAEAERLAAERAAAPTRPQRPPRKRHW